MKPNPQLELSLTLSLRVTTHTALNRFVELLFSYKLATMDDIAPEYDVVVLGTGRLPRHPATAFML